MWRALLHAFIATVLTGLSLYLWHISYACSDWAALALIPLLLVIGLGLWPLTLHPWKARLHLALREDSPLGKILTGKIRATFLSASFSFVAVTLLAWQALSASRTELAIMFVAFFLSACIFSAGQNILLRHFHQPFARLLATSAVTWGVAVPFTLVIALSTWTWATIPRPMLEASFPEALQIGFDQLPARDSWITGILSVPFGYESAKLWLVVQLREYPVVGALFSIDAALFSFVLCRSAVIITQFIETHVTRTQE